MAPIGWQEDVLQEISQIIYDKLAKADAKRPRPDAKIYRTPTPTSKGSKLRPKLHSRTPASSTHASPTPPPPKHDQPPPSPSPQPPPPPPKKGKPKPPDQAFRNLATPGSGQKVFTSLAKEWAWLNDQIRDIQRNKRLSADRKGDLPLELIKAVWGKGRGSTEEDDAPPAILTPDDSSWEAKYVRRKSKKERGPKVPETLMDVFLQSWVYFDHSHGDPVPKTERPVHAKYCDGYFGHFLLSDGEEIHGSSTRSTKQLIAELRSLLARLCHQIGNTHYKEIPVWKIPKAETLPEFIPSDPTPIPPFDPKEGLLPIPSDDIPKDSMLPTLEMFEPVPQPKYVPPVLIKAPVLKIPQMRNFKEDENAIDHNLYKNVPPPELKLPAPLPLPAFVEPTQRPIPPQPKPLESTTLPPVELEIIPLYRPPKPEPRPCESSYYRRDDGAPGVCDGLCGKSERSHAKDAELGPCIAEPPPILSPPPPLVIQLLPEPSFESPTLATLPPFLKPKVKDEPIYIGPPKPITPRFNPPPEPDPIGYLVGPRPVFLIDCSGTMVGERIKAVADCMQTLFSVGGQVEVAATHFDIIMYSFDAWSYGSMEVEKVRRQNAMKGEPLRYWTKNIDVLQEKTPYHMENALNWMLRWHPAGTTNLLRAIEVAMQRNSDCIYLFTDGKPDKPILILNMLKRLAKEKGRMIPINTIGMVTNRLGERFLRRLSTATGGTFKELDLRWNTKPPRIHGDELNDMIWARKLIEQYQRENVSEGRTLNIKDILNKVKDQYEEERGAPRLAAFKLEEAAAKHNYDVLLNQIHSENDKIISAAQDVYNQEVAMMRNGNNMIMEKARALWSQEVDKVKKINNEKKETYKQWEKQVEQFKAQQKKDVDNAKARFIKDLKAVEEQNAYNMLHAKEIYERVKKIKAQNEALLHDRQIRQDQLEKGVAAANSAAQFKYEKEVQAINELNEKMQQKARADYEAACAAVTAKNAQLTKDAEESYAKKLEEVRIENERRKKEFAQILENLRVLKETAMATHQEQVDAIIAEHDANIQNINMLNQKTEHQAKVLWKQACDTIAEENRIAAERVVKAWEEKTKQVQEANAILAQRRASLTARQEEVEKSNKELIKQRKAQWKELQKGAQAKYDDEVEAARLLHITYCKELEERNEKDIKKKLMAHQAKVAATETYNLTIQPYVEASRLVEDEVRRIERFLNYLIDNSPITKGAPGERKPSFERSLDILTSTEKPCQQNVVIEALQAAFVQPSFDIGRRRPTRAPSAELTPKKRSRFQGMVPIHPERVGSHSCVPQSRPESREDMVAELVPALSGLIVSEESQ